MVLGRPGVVRGRDGRREPDRGGRLAGAWRCLAARPRGDRNGAAPACSGRAGWSPGRLSPPISGSIAAAGGAWPPPSAWAHRLSRCPDVLVRHKIAQAAEVGGRHPSAAARALESFRSTAMAIPEILILRNLGIEPSVTGLQGAVLCAAIAWCWSRGGLKNVRGLEAAGAVVFLGGFLMVFFFRETCHTRTSGRSAGTTPSPRSARSSSRQAGGRDWSSTGRAPPAIRRAVAACLTALVVACGPVRISIHLEPPGYSSPGHRR